jgi:hypothetical protein
MTAQSFVNEAEIVLQNTSKEHYAEVRSRLMDKAGNLFQNGIAREIHDALPDTFEKAQLVYAHP